MDVPRVEYRHKGGVEEALHDEEYYSRARRAAAVPRALAAYERIIYASISYLARDEYTSALARLEFGHDHSQCTSKYDCEYLTGARQDASLEKGRALIIEGWFLASKMQSFEEIEAMFQKKLLEGSRLPPELAQFSILSKKKTNSPTPLTLASIASYIAKSIGPAAPDAEENTDLNFGLPEDVKRAESDAEIGILFALEALLKQRQELILQQQHLPVCSDFETHRCTPPLK